MAEGFDTNRFQSTIDTSFTCPICFGVLKDPMQCENNEHYFCSGCIKKHLEKTSHSCPVCQEKLTVETLRKAPRLIADVISRLKISCDHVARGCDAVLELEALQAHVQDCDFTPVTCSNDGCDEVVNKREVKHHERELCRFKTTTCDDCGKKMPHNEYGAHGCVLRRDVDEMKKDLAEVKATQHEMKESIQRMTIAMENIEKSCRNVSNVVNSLSSDIVVIAGLSNESDTVLSCVEQFNLFKQTWTPLAELKIARCAHAAVLFENQILVCGGSPGISGSDYSIDSIEVLDLRGYPAEWKEFSVNLPIKVAAHKCVVYGNRLLIIGGCTARINHVDADSLTDTIYDLLLVPPYSSKLLCHMKKKRAFHGVELFDDKVLIAGGHETETDVEIFDITRNECVEMPPLPSPVSGMATVRRGDTMLLIGGMDDRKNVSNQIIEYNFKTGQSKVELVMKTKLVGCAAFNHGDTLMIIGGAKKLPIDDPLSDTVDCFKFASRSWKKLSPMLKARVFAAGVIVKNDNFEI
jgi:hypothetical protein